jgi:hypothetical protein
MKARLGVVVLSGVILIGFFGVIGVLLWLLMQPLPSPNPVVLNILMMMFGSLATMTMGVTHYWFGTSNSSARKDDDLRAAQDALATSTPAPVTAPTN